MLLSYGTLVNQLHSLVKTKSQVKTLYISCGQSFPTRIPRRLIPNYRRTCRIPRPCSNRCPGYLQPSSIPPSPYTDRKTLIQRRRRPRSRIDLDYPTCYRPGTPRPTIPANPLHDRRNRRARPHTKSHRSPMILKLRVHGLQRPII